MRMTIMRMSGDENDNNDFKQTHCTNNITLWINNSLKLHKLMCMKSKLHLYSLEGSEIGNKGRRG